ncbi:DUF930 domain-containing protein [Neorhizobium sp. DT-125]|uniref:DUF930 domain-containing protein n=1 Tax=Neorhizobium sp. DT-125 TaxID=3396163 RepID=UPI003F540723
MDEPEKRRGEMGWGIPASILLHAVFAGILFFHLPLDVSEPQQEESVNVEIVPPPEEPEVKAEEAKQEEPKPPEPPKTEEAEKQEPPPPPPEPLKQQEEAKEEPPPPPPQPQEKAEQPEPPPPQQEEAKPEEQPSANEQATGQPIPVLRPVFEFGEKDSGPRKSETGNASQEAETPPAESPPDAEATEAPKSSEEPVVAEEPPANPLPEDIKVPEVDVASADPQQNGSASEISLDAIKADIAAAPSATVAQDEPSKTPAAGKPPELTEAKTLFSQNETGDPIATAAMGNVPRGVRAGQLCATEMQAQLRHSSPPYRPEIVQVYRLSSGTVLEVRRGAFRASAQWYDLSFRCEVDENATKVLSFAFDVGAAVPQSEWRKRGFPEF